MASVPANSVSTLDLSEIRQSPRKWSIHWRRWAEEAKGGRDTMGLRLLFIRGLSFIAAWFRGDWIVSRVALTSICRNPPLPTATGRQSPVTRFRVCSAATRIHEFVREISAKETCQIIETAPFTRTHNSVLPRWIFSTLVDVAMLLLVTPYVKVIAMSSVAIGTRVRYTQRCQSRSQTDSSRTRTRRRADNFCATNEWRQEACRRIKIQRCEWNEMWMELKCGSEKILLFG